MNKKDIYERLSAIQKQVGSITNQIPQIVTDDDLDVIGKGFVISTFHQQLAAAHNDLYSVIGELEKDLDLEEGEK